MRGLLAQLESISIDYAIAEHAQDVQVVPVDCGWSDVGSFATFEGYLAMNEHETAKAKKIFCSILRT